MNTDEHRSAEGRLALDAATMAEIQLELLERAIRKTDKALMRARNTLRSLEEKRAGQETERCGLWGTIAGERRQRGEVPHA